MLKIVKKIGGKSANYFMSQQLEESVFSLPSFEGSISEAVDNAATNSTLSINSESNILSEVVDNYSTNTNSTDNTNQEHSTEHNETDSDAVQNDQDNNNNISENTYPINSEMHSSELRERNYYSDYSAVLTTKPAINIRPLNNTTSFCSLSFSLAFNLFFNNKGFLNINIIPQINIGINNNPINNQAFQ